LNNRLISRFAKAFISACAIAAFAIAGTSYFRGSNVETHQNEFIWIPIQFLVLAAIILIYTIIPVLVILKLARSSSAPRGWTDILTGGLLGLIPALFLSRGMFSIMLWENVLTYCGAGALAGAAYWLLAGRPRPPYSHT
jgi:hypothetical protein